MKWTAILTTCLLLSATAVPADPSDSSAAVAEPTVELDILTLTSIEWQPGEPLPEAVVALNGKRVVIRGYMHGSIESDTRRFPFVSDSCQCVARLMPHHFVDVLVDEETEPRRGQFEVIGRLNVGPRHDEDGFVKSVFRLRGEIY